MPLCSQPMEAPRHSPGDLKHFTVGAIPSGLHRYVRHDGCNTHYIAVQHAALTAAEAQANAVVVEVRALASGPGQRLPT